MLTMEKSQEMIGASVETLTHRLKLIPLGEVAAADLYGITREAALLCGARSCLSLPEDCDEQESMIESNGRVNVTITFSFALSTKADAVYRVADLLAHQGLDRAAIMIYTPFGVSSHKMIDLPPEHVGVINSRQLPDGLYIARIDDGEFVTFDEEAMSAFGSIDFDDWRSKYRVQTWRPATFQDNARHGMVHIACSVTLAPIWAHKLADCAEVTSIVEAAGDKRFK